jgi:hypothetical protein
MFCEVLAKELVEFFTQQMSASVTLAKGNLWSTLLAGCGFLGGTEIVDCGVNAPIIKLD